MTLSFTETTITDEPAVDADVDGVEPSGWDDSFTPPMSSSANGAKTCVYPGCVKPPKPYGGRGKHPTRCDEHSRSQIPRDGATGAKTAAWKDKMYTQLCGTGMMIGMGLSQVDPFDAQCVITGWPNFAQRVVELSEADPKVRKFVERAMTGNAYVALVTAGLAMGAPIAMHHRLLPNWFNVPLAEPKPRKSRADA